MLMIEIQPLSNGAHRNQTCNLNTIPEGWAEVPSSITIPDTFPFVDIEVEGQTVTSMNPGVVPDPEPEPEAPPSQEERIAALEEEKRLLSQQVSALSQQNDFQEELIVELANIVYA